MLGGLSEIIKGLSIVIALFVGLTLMTLAMHWIIFVAPAAILVFIIWVVMQDTEDPPL